MNPTTPTSNIHNPTSDIPDSVPGSLVPVPSPRNPIRDISKLHLLRAAGTFYDKTTPDLRRHLIRAIALRTPRTFRAVYEHFNLADIPVSFDAFYRFARKIRARAELLDFVETTASDPERISTVLHRLAGVEAIDALRHSDEPGSAARLARVEPVYFRHRELELLTERAVNRAATDMEIAHTRAESRKEVARIIADGKRDVAQIQSEDRRECREIRKQE